MRRVRGTLPVLALVATGALPAGVAAAGGLQELTVVVGELSIHALCTSGPRQVLLLHDAGESAEQWRPVLERLEGSVGACAYDRPGSGRSTPAPGPRGWFELMDEMRRVHGALGFQRGYTLVGHGLGGLYARLYATGRPADVGSLVLVDPAHEDLPREMKPGMPRAEWEAWMEARGRVGPDGVSEAAIAERARGTRLPRIPVTVITALRRPRGDGWDERFLNQAAHRAHASLLRGLPISRHIPAGRSGPDVPRQDPDLVAAEIERVVRIATATRR